MKKLVVVVAAAIALSAWANVYDDVIWWCNGPVDRNGDGVLQQGEVVDLLHGGVPNDASHKGSMNRTSYISSETVTTPAFSRTLPCLKFEDSDANLGAWIDIGSQINAVYTQKAQAITSHVRFKWDGTSRNTAWLLYIGDAVRLGVNSTGVRFYPGENTSALPVTANTWYDIGFVLTKLATGGCNVRIILRKADGTTYRFSRDYASLDTPAANTNWRIATEVGAKDQKYFTGLIQQIAFWKRGLNDAELLEAFDYQPPMPDEAGVANASGAEFGGGAAATTTFGSSAWKDYPATLVRGSTASFTFTADAAPCVYALRVKSASGAATLKATAGGQEATAEIAAGGTVDLVFPKTAFTAGAANTITLTRIDDGGTFTPDSFTLVRQAKFSDDPIVYTADATVTSPLAIAADHVQPIDVAEGKTVVYTGVISGDGALLKTGLGTLKFAADNTFTGGATVEAGRILCDDAALTTPFGTGTVTVRQSGTGVCQAAVAGTLANDFVFTGASTEAFPGLHFANTTTLNGTVDAARDLWMTTAWDDTVRSADTVQVTLKGQVTVPGTLALAPHCRVKFNKTIACDTLNLCWAPNSAAVDGGNPGAVVLASCGDKTPPEGNGIACPMRKVLIDQTRVVQGGINIFGGRNSAPWGFAELEWTGLHKTGGSIDMAGGKMGLGRVVTPVTTADDETSMTILNSVRSSGNAPFLNFYDTPTSTNYLRCVGDINVQLATSGSTITFANRRHRSSTFRAAASRGCVTGSARFDVPVKFLVPLNGSGWTFAGMTDPEALRKVTEINMSGYGFATFDSVAFASLPQDYSLELTSGSGGNATYTFPSADSVLKVKRFNDRTHEREPGKWVDTSPHNENVLCAYIKPLGAQIWVAVDEATEASGSLTWDAAAEVWKDGDGTAVTDTSVARYATVTCAFSGADGAATATLPDTLFAQDLDLSTTGGGVKTLAGAAGSRVQVKGELTLSNGADYVFKPKMELDQAKTFALGAERSLAFDGGLSLTGTGTNVVESGTVSVSGALDGAIFVKGGATLALNGAVSSADTQPIIMETRATEPVSRLLLNGVTLDKPLSLGTVSSAGVFVIDATGDTAVTNVFAGRITDSGSTTMALREGYTYELRSAAFAGKHEFHNIGRTTAEETTAICREGVTQPLRGGDGYLNVRDSVRLVLDCSGLGSRTICAVDGVSILDFRRNDVWGGSYVTGDRAGILDVRGTAFLNKTHQWCGTLRDNLAGGRIHGEVGSAIEVCYGNNTVFAGAFEGAASLVMNGVGKQSLTGVSTSTGSLIVRQGTLELGASASWANASQVVLEGGTLSVLNRDAFGFDATELVLAGGQISGRVRFGSGNVKTADGRVLPNGVYGPASGWVAEGGSVTVGTVGLTIIFR